MPTAEELAKMTQEQRDMYSDVPEVVSAGENLAKELRDATVTAQEAADRTTPLTALDPLGLYAKYRVFKEPADADTHPVDITIFTTSDHSSVLEVESFVFVLKPDSDHHARVALAAYAQSVIIEKPELYNDLMDVLSDLS